MAAADGPTLDRVLAALEQQGAETAARFDQLQEMLVTGATAANVLHDLAVAGAGHGTGGRREQR